MCAAKICGLNATTTECVQIDRLNAETKSTRAGKSSKGTSKAV